MGNPLFKKVAFSVYPVTNMERSRQFYEKTLGFTPGDDFNGEWLEYNLASTTFAISSMIAQFIKPGTQNSVAFEVTDLDLVIADLKTKGVAIDPKEVMDTSVCRIAFVKDPDGNTVSLHQCK